MIAGITEWVKTIIFVVLFASFLELLLPASSMQRFVRVIMGLLIMLAMLNPVIDLIQNRFLPAQVPAMVNRNVTSYNNRLAEGAGGIVLERDRLAMELYKKDLARQIRAVVLAVEGVAEARVVVEVKESSGEGIGTIEKVAVYIQPGVAAAMGKVAPVTLGKGEEPKQEELTPAVVARINRTVKELYQLREGQVEIKRLN